MITKKHYWIRYTLLIFGCVLFIYPVIYAIGVGFMTRNQFASTPPSIIPFVPPLSFTNYKYLLLINIKGAPMLPYYYLNSVIRTAWYIVFVVLISFLTGYVFGRLNFKGKNLAFFTLLVSTMLPPVVTMAPGFLWMVRFPLVGGNNIVGQGGTGFLNTYTVLLVGGLVNVMGIFLVRMSLQTFPRELEDSGRMDGAGLFRIMFQIVLPIQKPILAYLAITTGIAIWNDWYTPFIFTSVDRHQTLASAVSRLTSVAVGQYGIPNWPAIITLGLGLTIPCLLLFAFFQRYIVQGLATAAVKG